MNGGRDPRTVRRHRAAKLADAIEAEIFSGALTPGSRLGSKADLIERYDISYGAFNEALRVCQERGLVTAQSGRGGGIFVASPIERRDPHAITTRAQVGRLIGECEQVRYVLERSVVVDAATSRAPEDVDDLMSILGRLETSSDDDASYRSEVIHLHWRIAKICRNRSLSRLYRMFLESVADADYDIARTPEFRRVNIKTQREVIAAIAAQNTQRAASLVSEHDPLVLIGRDLRDAIMERLSREIAASHATSEALIG
jgi:DNA-binding FadR family transcriptional regulator